MPQLRDCARLTFRRGTKWTVQDLDRLVNFGLASGLLLTLDEYLNRRASTRPARFKVQVVTLAAFADSVPEAAEPLSQAHLEELKARAMDGFTSRAARTVAGHLLAAVEHRAYQEMANCPITPMQFDDHGDYRFGRR